MHDLQGLTQRVRAAGGKMTSQRALIYATLAGDVTHPTAEEVYTRLRLRLPHLSLTTVYKTLNELVAWGEVRRIDAGDGRTRFDPDTRPHAEAVCLRCHRVTDVALAEAAALGERPPLPARIASYRVVHRAETFYGYCPRCEHDGALGS